jgi:hypothetical protein
MYKSAGKRFARSSTLLHHRRTWECKHSGTANILHSNRTGLLKFRINFEMISKFRTVPWTGPAHRKTFTCTRKQNSEQVMERNLSISSDIASKF